MHSFEFGPIRAQFLQACEAKFWHPNLFNTVESYCWMPDDASDPIKIMVITAIMDMMAESLLLPENMSNISQWVRTYSCSLLPRNQTSVNSQFVWAWLLDRKFVLSRIPGTNDFCMQPGELSQQGEVEFIDDYPLLRDELESQYSRADWLKSEYPATFACIRNDQLPLPYIGYLVEAAVLKFSTIVERVGRRPSLIWEQFAINQVMPEYGYKLISCLYSDSFESEYITSHQTASSDSESECTESKSNLECKSWN